MQYLKDLVYQSNTGLPKARVELLSDNETFFVRLSLRCIQMDELIVVDFYSGNRTTIQQVYHNYQERAYNHTLQFGYPQIQTNRSI